MQIHLVTVCILEVTGTSVFQHCNVWNKTSNADSTVWSTFHHPVCHLPTKLLPQLFLWMLALPPCFDLERKQTCCHFLLQQPVMGGLDEGVCVLFNNKSWSNSSETPTIGRISQRPNYLARLCHNVTTCSILFQFEFKQSERCNSAWTCTLICVYYSVGITGCRLLACTSGKTLRTCHWCFPEPED